MKFINKIIAIIYRMYDDRGISIPHFRAIITVVLILFFHVIHMGLIFDIPSKWLLPFNTVMGKSIQWLVGLIYFGALISFLSFLFSKSKLDKIEVTQKQIDKAKIIVPLYLITSILLLTGLLIKSGIEKGKINL